MLSERSSNLLNSYVLNKAEFASLWDWLAESEYDESLLKEERDTLASIRLVAIEVDEGLRATDELREAIRSVLRLESTMSCDFTVRAVTTEATSSTSPLSETVGPVSSGIIDVRIQPAGAS